MNKKRVFISYRHKTSSGLAVKLSEILSKWFDVSCDINYEGGSVIKNKINEGIDNCSFYIILLDKKTLLFSSKNERKKRKWIIYELARVMENKDAKIIPVLINGCKMNDIKRSLLIINEEDKNDEEDRRCIEDIKKIGIVENKGVEYKSYRKQKFYSELFDSLEIEKTEVENYLNKLKIKNITWITIIVSVLVFAIGIWLGLMLKPSVSIVEKQEPTLVFAGGGSVANMIRELTTVKTIDRIVVGDAIKEIERDSVKVDVTDYRRSFYLNMPSKNAWPLMTEEVMNNHTSDLFTNKFYPVCLSAWEATENDFLGHLNKKDFYEKGTVISYNLGNDTLVVFTRLSRDDGREPKFSVKLSEAINNLELGNSNDCGRMNNAISVDDLSYLVECIRENNDDDSMDKVYVYCTQERSGTHSCYDHNLKVSITKDTLGGTLDWYDDTSESGQFFGEDSKNYFIVLSSKFYIPKKLGVNIIKNGMVVEKAKDSAIFKPMCLYFVGYKANKKGPIRVPQVMVELLKELVRDSLDKEYIKTEMSVKDQSVITDFDDLLRHNKEISGI